MIAAGLTQTRLGLKTGGLNKTRPRIDPVPTAHDAQQAVGSGSLWMRNGAGQSTGAAAGTLSQLPRRTTAPGTGIHAYRRPKAGDGEGSKGKR